MRVLSFSGSHNLTDKFEEEVYTMVIQPSPDMPVVTVLKADDNT